MREMIQTHVNILPCKGKFLTSDPQDAARCVRWGVSDSRHINLLSTQLESVSTMLSRLITVAVAVASAAASSAADADLVTSIPGFEGDFCWKHWAGYLPVKNT